jgi:hypothetical protein
LAGARRKNFPVNGSLRRESLALIRSILIDFSGLSAFREAFHAKIFYAVNSRGPIQKKRISKRARRRKICRGKSSIRIPQ